MATPTAASPRGVRSACVLFFCFQASAAPVGPVLSGYFIPLFFIRGGYELATARTTVPNPELRPELRVAPLCAPLAPGAGAAHSFDRSEKLGSWRPSDTTCPSRALYSPPVRRRHFPPASRHKNVPSMSSRS